MRESEGFAIDRRWEAGWVFNGFRMGLQWVLVLTLYRLNMSQICNPADQKELFVK